MTTERRIVVEMGNAVPTDAGRGTPGRAPALTLARLYERERVPMIRLAVLLVGSLSVAEEVVQDAFVVVSQRWARLDNPGGYLRTTVVNGCRMHLRRQATERKYSHEDALSVDTPTELIELRDALSRLTERERLAIVLRYFVDLDDSATARILECRPATVRSLVRRALRSLRKELT
ncbi:MAG: sigma-70 family RNA polymerase sigma factor [Acidimicrobiia bacterium]